MEQDARKVQVPIKGRGSASRVPSRFDATTTVGVDDGWESIYEDLQELPRLRTEVTEERARTVISRNNSPDVGFGASVNPYRGCEHGCVYCFARPSHSYLSLSPGLDFETKLFAKTNAAERLRNELSRPNYQCAAIALGINTDGYQPIERSYQITRQCLELLAETRHPVSFVTKSALITRDIDLLAAMAKDRLVTVYFSVTTLDRKLSAKLEPRAAAPHARLRAMETLHKAACLLVYWWLLSSPASLTTNSRRSSKKRTAMERGLQATCCCDYPTRSRTSGKSGWNCTIRTGQNTFSALCASCMVARSTTPHSVPECEAQAPLQIYWPKGSRRRTEAWDSQSSLP